MHTWGRHMAAFSKGWVNQGCKLGVFAKYSEIMARVHWGKLRYGLIDARAEKFPTDMHTVLLGSI